MRELFLIVLQGLLSSDRAVEYFNRNIIEDDLKSIPDYHMVLSVFNKHYEQFNKAPTHNSLMRQLPKNIHHYVLDCSNINFDYRDFKIACDEMSDHFKKETLARMSDWLKINKSKPIKELIEIIHTTLDNMTSGDDIVIPASMSADMFKSRFNNPKDEDYISTGDSFFDMYISLKKTTYVLAAADKKMGKSRYWARKIYQICRHNSNVHVQWHSLEMTDYDVMMSLVAIHTNIKEMKIRKQKSQLTAYEVQLVNNALDFIKNMPIEFISSQAESINDVTRKFRRFCKHNPNDTNVLLIDNIGCLTQMSDNDTSNENDIARKLMQVRDDTNGLIVALHHMGKEVNNKFNKDKGYEPTINHIRGSSRLADFANIVLLQYRPASYKDLIKEASNMTDKIYPDKLSKYYKVIIGAHRNSSIDDRSEIHYTHDMDIAKFIELSI